jgi:prepilin-type N-terminal cleavage/methylation domain-containing protein
MAKNVTKQMKKGFTLVEMMIVVAIIAVLAGVAIPQYGKYVKKSETTEAIRFMKQIIDAEILYYSTNKKYKEFDGTDAGKATLKNTLEIEIPKGANFKSYAVKACGADKNKGMVVTSWTTDADAKVIGKTVYTVYPKGAFVNASNSDYFTGASFIKDYVDESTSESDKAPKCANILN